MTKTIHRIRLPEVKSGAITHTHISSEFFVGRKGVLRSVSEKTRPTLLLRWRSDVTSGKPVAYRESSEEPGPRLHPFRYFIARRNHIAI